MGLRRDSFSSNKTFEGSHLLAHKHQAPHRKRWGAQCLVELPCHSFYSGLKWAPGTSMRRVGGLVSLFLLIWTSSAFTQFDEAKLVLHLVEGSGLPQDCSTAPLHLACNNDGEVIGDQVPADIQGDTLTDYQAYVLLADIDSSSGLKEVTFSLSYENSVTVSGWRSCVAEGLPSDTWPASGSDITLRFSDESGCAHPTPDPFDAGHRGVVPLLVLSVRATAPGLLRLVAPANEFYIPFTDCSDSLSAVWSPYGEVGFGYKIGLDPCTRNPTAHGGCGVYFNCICCFGTTCRPAGEGYIYDARDCYNDRGTLKADTNDCKDCMVATHPATWGMLKDRFR